MADSSVYPGASDGELDDIVPDGTAPDGLKDYLRLLGDAVARIQETLGLDPQGEFADVVARLDAGGFDTAADQTITGNWTFDQASDTTVLAIDAENMNSNSENIFELRNEDGDPVMWIDSYGDLYLDSVNWGNNITGAFDLAGTGSKYRVSTFGELGVGSGASQAMLRLNVAGRDEDPVTMATFFVNDTYSNDYTAFQILGQFGIADAPYFRVNHQGYMSIGGVHVAPDDADIESHEIKFWYDDDDDDPKLMVKAKTAVGRVVIGEVALVDPPDVIVPIAEFTFPGGDTTGWTVSGSWSESPTDWVTATGNGVGTTYLRRALPSGTVYAETTMYVENPGSEWGTIRIEDGSSDAIYDATAHGALMRGTGALAIPWSDGSDASIGAGDLPAGANSQVDKVVLGIGVDGTDVTLWVDGVLRQTYTGTSARGGGYLTIGAYNGSQPHFESVRCYDVNPYI